MTGDELVSLTRTVPFVPFTIRLPSGRVAAIRHPEYLAVAPSGHYAIAFKPEGGFTMIDLNMIEAIDVEPPRAAPGTKRKGR